MDTSELDDAIVTPIQTILDRLREMGTELLLQLPNIIIGAIIFSLVWVVANRLRPKLERMLQRSNLSKQASIAFSRIAMYVLLVFGAFLALVTIFPSLNIEDVVQVLGVSGVAIGFAFREILQNFFAGLLLLINEPFQIGDQIIYSDYEGTVKHIETRSTTIRTYDGRDVVVPNAELFTNPVTVNTAQNIRRYEAVIGIAYNSNIEHARAVALSTIKGIDRVLDDPKPSVLVASLGDSSINLRARWWARSKNIEGILSRDEMLTEIVAHFEAEGIAIPFPTREVVFQSPLIIESIESKEG